MHCDNTHIRSLIHSYLEKSTFNFSCHYMGHFQLLIHPDNYVHEVKLCISTYSSGFAIKGIFPFIVPENRFCAAFDFTNIVNRVLERGSLIFDPEQRLLYFQLHCGCEDKALTDTAVHDSICCAEAAVKKYLSAVFRLLFHGVCAEEAAACELPVSNRHPPAQSLFHSEESPFTESFPPLDFDELLTQFELSKEDLHSDNQKETE